MGLPWEDGQAAAKPKLQGNERPQNGRLRILSSTSLWLMNSSYGNDARHRGRRFGVCDGMRSMTIDVAVIGAKPFGDRGLARS
jgi:hypothetical protein